MKKIIFGITGLTLGGAERVLVDIANRLSDKFDITIFTLYAKGEFEDALKPNIKRISVFDKQYKDLTNSEKKKISFYILFRKKYLYNNYLRENYDVQVAFLEGPITRLFSYKSGQAKKIAWVHNDMNRVFGTGIKAKLKIAFEKKSYKAYDKLIFVSKDNLESFEKNIKIDKPKQIIYNYIDSQNVKEKSLEVIDLKFDENAINIVSVARLVEQKGIDRWIRVHSKIRKEGINQKVYIIGDGPLKEALQKQIKNEGVEDSFILVGQRLNPYPYIRMADYFALLSYFEGYGMVLEEAKILDKPILITDTAAREAVNGYANSKILNNTEDGIYEGLKKLKEKPKVDSCFHYSNGEKIEKIIELMEE